MQQDFSKYGKKNFRFEVLDIDDENYANEDF